MGSDVWPGERLASRNAVGSGEMVVMLQGIPMRQRLYRARRTGAVCKGAGGTVPEKSGRNAVATYGKQIVC
jgi:hypothetical protein